MPKVTFLPAKKVVEAKAGQTILETALEHGIQIQHACGGFCACTTCHVIVKSGDDHLSGMDENEEDRLDRASGVTLHSRLSCQAKVQGDLTVEVVNPE